jgi:DNA-binding transcriptional regulator YdaS (Cro superfamily)
MQASHSPDIGQSMNSAVAKLLQAAAEFVGGDKELAVRLGITQSLLGKLMAGRFHVPDPLLLQAVDIVLADRPSLIPLATRTSGFDGDSRQ